jgi:hypothetical protein
MDIDGTLTRSFTLFLRGIVRCVMELPPQTFVLCNEKATLDLAIVRFLVAKLWDLNPLGY